MPETYVGGARRREQIIVGGHQGIRMGSARCLDRPCWRGKTTGE
jgi:hypothetical protein